MRGARVLLDWLLPRTCEVCDAALPAGAPPALCAACLATIVPPEPPLCAHCGLPLPTATPLCSQCRAYPPRFDAAHAVGLYRPAGHGHNPLARAIHALKYRGRRCVAPVLGGLLARHYAGPPDALVVPVPLHRARLRARGFNQAFLLARTLARRRHLALAPVLERTRETPPQRELGRRARRANLAAAFAVPRAAHVDGRHVVLVDDVLTTGATADACAHALRTAGAAGVYVLTVGRTP